MWGSLEWGFKLVVGCLVVIVKREILIVDFNFVRYKRNELIR